MRVLYLETPTGYGGSMQSLLELIEYLPPEVETVVAVPYEPRQYRGVPERIELEFVQSPRLRGFHGYVRLLTQQFGWYRVVKRLLRAHRPDLLHLNNLFFGCFGGAIAAKQRGIAVISHARGFLVSRHLARRVIRFIDHHIAVSRAVARHLIEHGAPDEKVGVIYDPIISPDDLVPVREPDGIVRIGMLGMLQRWKGQHVFVEALHHLAVRQVGFRAFIAGTEPFGARGYEQLLRDMVQRYGLENNLQFLGFVANPFEFLRRMDIVVHASIEPEPLARVAPEAMLSGAAVIATNGGGMPDLVEHERTGLLVPMGDAEAMADAIERLLRNKDLRQRLAEAGRQRAREMFDPHKHAREVMGVYGKVLVES